MAMTGFYVFSGTGNTLKAASLLVSCLQREGHEAFLERITKDSLARKLPDRIVIAFPVHGFNTPIPVLKFIKSLPSTEKEIPAYIVMTSGEPLSFNNAAYLQAGHLLKKKGFRLYGVFHYVMPYNIIFRHSNPVASRMWNIVKKRCTEDSHTIACSHKHPLQAGLIQRLISLVLRIEHLAMPVIGRGFESAESCTGCGLCVSNCPQNNIMIKDGRASFAGECCGCMACAFSCPHDAVRTSILNHWRVNGKYDFQAKPAKDDEIGRWCRKSYLKYFHTFEKQEN